MWTYGESHIVTQMISRLFKNLSVFNIFLHGETLAFLPDPPSVRLPAKVIKSKNHLARSYFLVVVDLRGVEPRPDPCHGSVMPLYYRPASRFYSNYILAEFIDLKRGGIKNRLKLCQAGLLGGWGAMCPVRDLVFSQKSSPSVSRPKSSVSLWKSPRLSTRRDL